MVCENCKLGKSRTIIGNGITEPPYIDVIKCKFDDEYYKYPDTKCEFEELRKEQV